MTREPSPNWRIGRKLGRTIYHFEKLVGMFDEASVAAHVVQVLNAYENSPNAATPATGQTSEPSVGEQSPGIPVTRDDASSTPLPLPGNRPSAGGSDSPCACGHILYEHIINNERYRYGCGQCACAGFRPPTARDEGAPPRTMPCSYQCDFCGKDHYAPGEAFNPYPPEPVVSVSALRELVDAWMTGRRVHDGHPFEAYDAGVRGVCADLSRLLPPTPEEK